MTLYFLNGSNHQLENHCSTKEYRDDVLVEIKGAYYEVYFFTKDALEYEMTKAGFFAFPGIIILDTITTDTIVKSVTELKKKGFFNSFKGADCLMQKRFINDWYENELAPYNATNLKTIKIN